MAYRVDLAVDLAARAERDLRHIYQTINAADSTQARAWFNGLEKLVHSLGENPGRGAVIPEDGSLRHVLSGRRRHLYRVIYALDEERRVVTVLHVRHGARDAFVPDEGE